LKDSYIATKEHKTFCESFFALTVH